MDRTMRLLVLCMLTAARCTEFDVKITQELQTSFESTFEQKHENVADAVNDFGYKLLLTMMKETTEQNVVISPTSIAGLLGMTLLGTVGKTHEELAGALGFSQDIIQSRKNHEQFGDLLRSLNANDTSSETLYADALFVDKHASLRDMYRGYLKRVYNGEAFGIDFKRPVEAKDFINQWVDSHTEGKIEHFLSKPLPVQTKAVLLSALYFRGQWEKPFLKEYTAKKTFTTPSNQVMADLMLNMGEFNYIYSQENDMHMVALPYNDSTTTLYALKPRVPHRLSLYDLMNGLDSTKINQLIEKMEKAKCVIRFPKMDLHKNIKLENSLRTLGVHSLFVPGTANFALMIDSSVPNKTETEIIARIHEESNLVLNNNEIGKKLKNNEKGNEITATDAETKSEVEENDPASTKIEVESVSKTNLDNKTDNTESETIPKTKTGGDVSVHSEVEINSRIRSDSRDLKDILESLPNPGLYVDSIIHDVKLNINEYGTEAAAATSGVLGRTANLFYADTPFYMFIRNEKTKLITFSAIINNPTL